MQTLRYPYRDSGNRGFHLNTSRPVSKALPKDCVTQRFPTKTDKLFQYHFITPSSMDPSLRALLHSQQPAAASPGGRAAAGGTQPPQRHSCCLLAPLPTAPALHAAGIKHEGTSVWRVGGKPSQGRAGSDPTSLPNPNPGR